LKERLEGRERGIHFQYNINIESTIRKNFGQIKFFENQDLRETRRMNNSIPV
jgi:hypothetical protein